MTKNVVFDEDSAARIAAAVKWVEQYSVQEVAEYSDYGPETVRLIIRGTFSGIWAKDTEHTVSFTADNGEQKTKQAFNYVADAGISDGASDCVIALAGGEWVLVEAKHSTNNTTCVELSTVEPAGTITLLSQVSLTGTVVTGVACVNGNITVTTANLSSLFDYTEQTIGLSDLATVTAQNLTLPKQEGCS
jgi:hypothetical protein